jgi:Catalase
LLQGRLSSYVDTQLSHLGSPNFHQLPVNAPKCPFANLQRDGIHQLCGPAPKTQWDGRIYFPAVGGLLVFTLGCAAASISPKPLFIEDQTFLEGAVITAQRQGPCLLISGIAFGACYWWLERRIRASS